jgi:phosphoglycolate phosphatase
MESLKISGEESVMVGDHLIDVQAGKGAGMKTIGVLTGRISKEEFEKAGADYILRDASEICNLIPPSPPLVKGGRGGITEGTK